MDVHIPPLLMDLFEETHPDCGDTSQAKAAAIRDELRLLWRARKMATTFIAQNPDFLQSEATTARPLTAREIADIIATQAPRIDDQNWQAIKRGVEAAQAQGRWEATNHQDLVERLNVDFEGAMNEYRVQKSRITAYFERLLGL